jgi:hypothetical protein
LSEVGADILGVVANDVPSAAASRFESGHWQYAAARGRDGTRETAVVAMGAHPSGDLLARADDGAAFTADSISIRELEWPAERP